MATEGKNQDAGWQIGEASSHPEMWQVLDEDIREERELFTSSGIYAQSELLPVRGVDQTSRTADQVALHLVATLLQEK